MRVSLGYELFGRFPFSHITRPASASPATGSSSSHKKEQEKLLNEAFGV
jgi:2-oxoglutarate dehydrogenase complex dehydrogenase (E1) component-like enzyme